MVRALSSCRDIDNVVESKRIALIAYLSRSNHDLWNYVEKLLQRLEHRAGYLIDFFVADIDSLEECIAAEEREIAKKNVVIKLFFEGSCIFEQEGVFGSLELDIQALKRGIKDVLKKRNIKTLF